MDELKNYFTEQLIEELNKEGDALGIRSIRIDFDNDVLEINGEPYKKKTIVSLPASDGWKFRKLFNGDENNAEKASDRLNVDLLPAIHNRL